MFPARFDYARAASWDEAIGLLAEHGPDAKLLAGGCSLIPLLKLRLAEPRLVVDLRRVPAGEIVIAPNGELRIGALVTEAQVEHHPAIVAGWPALAETCAVVADPIVRNMGTLGGNVAHADPANDHPATLLALGARFVARGLDGERVVDADDFFVDLFETALGPADVLTEIRLPALPAGSGAAYVKLERQVGDFAIVGVAARVDLRDGVIVDARVALTNAAATAVRARAAEAALVGLDVAVDGAPEARGIDAAAAAVTAGLRPWDELRGSAAYKLDVLPAIARRAIRRALARASGGDLDERREAIDRVR